MFNQDNDIIELHHCVDDGECPVTDQLKEDMYYHLPIEEREQIDEKNRIEAIAMDSYWQTLEETGDTKAAQQAFFDTLKSLHGSN